jgi:hypothetical protein
MAERDGRATYKAPSAFALYLERAGSMGRIWLGATAVWLLGLFATAILIRVGIWPLWAGLAWFIGLAALAAWGQWQVRAGRYARAAEDENAPDGSGL